MKPGDLLYDIYILEKHRLEQTLKLYPDYQGYLFYTGIFADSPVPMPCHQIQLYLDHVNKILEEG